MSAIRGTRTNPSAWGTENDVRTCREVDYPRPGRARGGRFNEAALAERALTSPGPPPLRVVEGGERFATPLRRRDGLRRLLLCGADIFAAAAAMVLVLTVFGEDRLKLVTLAATPVIVLLFKLAGLYDREQQRLHALNAGRGAGARPGRRPLRADDCHRPAPCRGRASLGRSDRRPLADELHRHRCRTRVRPLGGWPRLGDGALPGDRRRDPRASDPGETEQQPRPRGRRRDAPARGERDRSPRRARGGSPPRR